jgi:hypothetical protein
MIAGLTQIALLVPLIITSIFLSGGSSKAAAQYCLYEVNATRLAEHLGNESDVDAASLVPPELPSFWSFGFSGKMVASHGGRSRVVQLLTMTICV